MKKNYISIVGCFRYFGMGIFEIGQVLKLKKDPENKYDSEAISVYMRNFGKIGYVANSIKTVPRGCKSAGRIYDTFKNATYAKVKFIMDDSVIAEILTKKPKWKKEYKMYSPEIVENVSQKNCIDLDYDSERDLEDIEDEHEAFSRKKEEELVDEVSKFPIEKPDIKIEKPKPKKRSIIKKS